MQVRRRHVLLALGVVVLVCAQVLFPQVEPVTTGGKVVFSARGWGQLAVYLFSILALAGYMAVETPGTVSAIRGMGSRPARALGRLAVTGAGVGAAVHLAGPYSTLAVAAVMVVAVYGALTLFGVRTEL
jgi:hypothetical protein